MKQQNVLFIQGGGDGGYQADQKLVDSLKKELGALYTVRYPEILPDESAADFGWPEAIRKCISEMAPGFILAGHSFGASMILKSLSEEPVSPAPGAVFLLATPFWSGEESWVSGIKLKAGFAERLPKDVPVFFYHCKDDEEVPFAHFNKYRDLVLPGRFRSFQTGGHPFNNDLREIARDIKSFKTEAR